MEKSIYSCPCDNGCYIIKIQSKRALRIKAKYNLLVFNSHEDRIFYNLPLSFYEVVSEVQTRELDKNPDFSHLKANFCLRNLFMESGSPLLKKGVSFIIEYFQTV
ncbi:hypothetical protein CDAR_116571 [Caerostris darwini]|uniref:Uncharacterized protein n=1 Tax=Caerostris darwini TaxID=1538125 RepID=A0AAV4R3U9_9ARAC|nr:hypothetical protein CDAR_116571 [Caerostris darwini]